MGNTNQTQNKSLIILEKYQFINKLSEDKQIYKNKSNSKQYLSVSRTFATHQMMLEYEKKMRITLQIQHPYFLNETQHAIVTVSTICSLQHKVMHFFQYELHNLQSELRTRHQHNRHFQQKQIWSILCSCVLAMSHLTKNNIMHFCIHPRDIVIDNLGMIKIVSTLISQNNEQILNQDYYYSPEHLKAFKNSIFNNLNNKSSVFTLGITLLHIILLQTLNDIYDFSNHVIRMDILNQKIEMIQSEEMKEIIKKMLISQSYDRISFTELEEMLYNILESHSQDNSKVSKSSCHQSNLNVISNQNYQKEPCQKLKESIYQIQKAERHEDFFQPFQSFNKILVTKSMPQDRQDEPANHELHSEIDQQKVDEEDSLPIRYYAEKKNTNKCDSNTLNHTTSILSNRQQSILTNNLNNSTQRLALQQITYSNSNMPTVNNRKQSKSRLLQTNNFTNSLKSLKSSKMSIQDPNQPYHIREELSRGVYEGYKLNKMRHGYGVFTYAEGGKYCGEWNKNKMQGRGALYYANQQIAYEGEWKDDKLHGYGILYNEVPTYFSEEYEYKSLHLVDNYWVKYEGNFVEDLKNGEGTLFLANGQYYRGYFHDDLPHGNGIYRCMNGKIIKGNWILGILQTN